MPEDLSGQGIIPAESVSSPSAFDKLKQWAGQHKKGLSFAAGGLSGFGESMMDKNFRSAYNAGQSGLSNLYGTIRMGQGIDAMSSAAKINKIRKQASDILGSSRNEILERGMTPTVDEP